MRFTGRGGYDEVIVAFVIGHETFESSYSHGVALAAENAIGFALNFLGADSPTDGRQGIIFADFLGGLIKLSLCD
jgi:hypothetical protein